ncbi:hypothetical protein FRC08_000803 [Ceratobasidium sp. 394]|nr:hypothetical protein FRC08_000803 [Ceratobasidium sp. 394]KAG9096132.1 hypothetical protein FS749_009071 [Ceratobasidium sp. UAMH 11750]
MAAIDPASIVFAVNRQPKGTPGKNFTLAGVLGLDTATYRFVMGVVKSLCVASGLDMTRTLAFQDRQRILTAYMQIMKAFPALDDFGFPCWPLQAFVYVTLKATSDAHYRQEARRRSAQARALAFFFPNSTSTLDFPPLFPRFSIPIVFSLASFQVWPRRVVNSLIDVPLVLWPWLSLSALHRIPSFPLFMISSAYRPSWTMTLTSGVLAPCVYLTREWNVRFTLALMVEEIQAGPAGLPAVLLQWELL